MDKASEAILALKPVTFRYKQDLDPGKNPPWFRNYFRQLRSPLSLRLLR